MVRVQAVLSGSSLSKGEVGAAETVQRGDESMREQEHREMRRSKPWNLRLLSSVRDLWDELAQALYVQFFI